MEIYLHIFLLIIGYVFLIKCNPFEDNSVYGFIRKEIVGNKSMKISGVEI